MFGKLPINGHLGHLNSKIHVYDKPTSRPCESSFPPDHKQKGIYRYLSSDTFQALAMATSSSEQVCMRACDEPVVKLNRLISNCRPGKRLFDALAPCFSELSGLFGICHEI